jgi:hypothetical protein
MLATELSLVLRVTSASSDKSEEHFTLDATSSSTTLQLIIGFMLSYFFTRESRATENDLRIKEGAPGPPKRNKAPFLTRCGIT